MKPFNEIVKELNDNDVRLDETVNTQDLLEFAVTQSKDYHNNMAKYGGCAITQFDYAYYKGIVSFIINYATHSKSYRHRLKVIADLIDREALKELED